MESEKSLAFPIVQLHYLLGGHGVQNHVCIVRGVVGRIMVVLVAVLAVFAAPLYVVHARDVPIERLDELLGNVLGHLRMVGSRCVSVVMRAGLDADIGSTTRCEREGVCSSLSDKQCVSLLSWRHRPWSLGHYEWGPHSARSGRDAAHTPC